jgi:hypothetical protein
VIRYAQSSRRKRRGTNQSNAGICGQYRRKILGVIGWRPHRRGLHAAPPMRIGWPAGEVDISSYGRSAADFHVGTPKVVENPPIPWHEFRTQVFSGKIW